MQTFEMASTGGRAAMWLVVTVIVILVLVAAMLVFALRPARFEITAEGLRIRGSVYGRLIPAAQLNLHGARVVDLNASPELKPKWRTNGIGLPGHLSGWVRLANREKALVFLTDRTRVVYIPTNAGYSVLLSPADPDAFLAALRAAPR